MKKISISLIMLLILSCTGKDDMPNIIYISIEDMKPDLACYGNPIVHSPNLDDFAGDAVLFRDVHCQVALCTPSRTSVLTGIRPSTSGMVKIDDDWQQFLPDAVSLPRHLKDQGYLTIQAGKIHDYRNGGMDSAYQKSFDIHGIHDNTLALKALNYASKQTQPFFLAVGYGQVHLPWNATHASKNYYNPADMPVENRSHHFKGAQLSDEDLRNHILDYYAYITDVDSLIGVLLDSAKVLGLYDKAIILIGAMDHGYNLGYRNHWGKGNNYDNETMVPLMIRVPGNPNNGSATSGIVELVDIYPTLIDYAGISNPPQELEGYSIRGLLENPGREWKKAAFTHRAYHVQDRGIKTSDYTLVLRENEAPRLFDRKTDPNNIYNIAEEMPEKVEELKNLLEAGWKAAKPEN